MTSAAITVATLTGAVVFLVAPAETRVADIALGAVYGSQHITTEYYPSSLPPEIIRDGKALISATSGQNECFEYLALPTIGLAKDVIVQWKSSISRTEFDKYDQLTAPLGEETMILKQKSGRYELRFQRDNVIATIYSCKGSPLPIGSAEELASLEATARTFDNAIVGRRVGVGVSSISHGGWLVSETYFWWNRNVQDHLPRLW